MGEKENNQTLRAWIPELLYTAGRFRSGLALLVDERGCIERIAPENDIPSGTVTVSLRGRALLPGLVNAHSHAFQRTIRGRTERRQPGHEKDSFWTWREEMYSAAMRLSPTDIYDASRMAFLEMALGGITTVGEFHYIHRSPSGTPYDDPNLLAKQVIAAARDTGLRIALLRVAYARSGFQTPPNERQRRFIEADVETYLRNADELLKEIEREYNRDEVWMGTAPHSVRALPLDYLRACFRFAEEHDLPVHMHVSEQPAEIEACLKEHNRTPVLLLAEEGLIGPRLAAVHAIHITAEEARLLARASSVCACPTTERNLGDGIVPADMLFKEGVRVSLGTDSHTQINLLEDARELEYHLRLSRLERAVLANYSIGVDEPYSVSSLAARLFECATVSGAHCLAAPAGELTEGALADFFTVDLNDPSIAGANSEDLLAALLFSLERTAVRDVSVGGRLIVSDCRHTHQEQIIERFRTLQQKLWQ